MLFIDPLKRIDVDNIETLIAQRRYFVLHALRQTGKSTCLLELMHYFNQQGKYEVLYTDIEAAQALNNDVKEAIATVCYAIAYQQKIT